MRIFLLTFAGLILGLSGTVFTATGSASASVLSQPLYASASKSYACDGLNTVDGEQTCDGSTSKLNGIVYAAVKIVSFITGIAAIIMVLLSGLKYITSGGDANKVASAKTTLIYALIGAAVAAAAQVLVHFAINEGVAADGKCHDGNSAHASLSAQNENCGK